MPTAEVRPASAGQDAIEATAGRLRGHFWTLLGLLGRQLRPPRGPAAAAWHVELDDRVTGRVELSGALHVPERARALVLMVHGLGGSAESLYLHGAAAGAASRGIASLRLSLRGADRSGADFYHAGLVADLEAALASPALARFERLYALGYSLGGHLVLRLACQPHDARLRAVAAVCAPLDLRATGAAIDATAGGLYRLYLLRHMRRMYRPVAERHAWLARPAEVARVRTLRQWDSLTVAPRFGFADADDYYRQESVGPLLDRMRKPALLVLSRHDPMVPASTVAGPLAAKPVGLEVRWVARGGHLAFPRHLDLGYAGAPGLERQVMAWLAER